MLATLFHQRVFARRGEHVCVNNLGGISNVTSLDWRAGRQPRIAAFDTGPANVLIDLAMRHFTGGKLAMDRNGSWARRGRPSERLIGAWLKHPFFTQPPPKSTGRELFGEKFFRKVLAGAERAQLAERGVVASLTEFTAQSIAMNYKWHLLSAPHRVVLTGGGAANPTLVTAIEKQLAKIAPDAKVMTSTELGWPLQSVEPAAFSLLAYLRWTRH
jgi:anhydro-N-acetylmuramic acid kinase